MRRAGNRPHFHCPACDLYHFPEETGDGVIVAGEPVGAACPVCRLPLQSALIEDETVCYCDHCRGFLTPMDAFGRIVGKRRARHGSHEQRPEPFDPAELRRVLTCPDCGGRMDAHPYSGGGNAVVDACESCNLSGNNGDKDPKCRLSPHGFAQGQFRVGGGKAKRVLYGRRSSPSPKNGTAGRQVQRSSPPPGQGRFRGTLPLAGRSRLVYKGM